MLGSCCMAVACALEGRGDSATPGSSTANEGQRQCLARQPRSLLQAWRSPGALSRGEPSKTRAQRQGGGLCVGCAREVFSEQCDSSHDCRLSAVCTQRSDVRGRAESTQSSRRDSREMHCSRLSDTSHLSRCLISLRLRLWSCQYTHFSPGSIALRSFSS